jgi:hypothetical protein
MPQRKLARVLPEPVGAQISALAPPEIASQPPACAGVGPSKEASNQRLTGALKGASGLDPVLVLVSVVNPPILRSRRYGVPPANFTYAGQDFFGTKPSLKRPEPSQKLQAPAWSSTENQ